MGFSRQEHWSGLSFPSPGDLPDPWIEPMSHVSPALAGGFFTTEPPEKPGRQSKKARNNVFFLVVLPTIGFLFLSLKSDLPMYMCARERKRGEEGR